MIAIRRLSADAWSDFREMRLLALRSEPGLFYRSAAEDAELNEADWRALLADEKHRIFGVFDGERLVGITAALTARTDPSGRTAVLGMSFLRPEYRRRGLAHDLYRVRMEWIRGAGRFARATVSHRRSNEASRRAIERAGFAQVGVEPHTWPDGGEEDDLLYELRLE